MKIKVKIKVKVYDGIKYEASYKKVTEVEYDRVKSAKVVELSDKEIYDMGFDEVDLYGEYFILEHEDGETSTFRNSLVDAFRI